MNFGSIVLFIYIITITFFKAVDCLTSPLGKSIYNFVIQTPTKKEYLWKLNDYLLESHTGDFLAEQIDQIIQQIGNKRFGAIFTDGASNVRLAREIITAKYPHN